MTEQSGTCLCLFGSYPVRVNGQPYYLGISGTTEKLFQYLLVNAGKETRREFLAELFWRGSSAGRQRSALNSAICRIRKQLTDIEGVEVVCDGPAVFLSIADKVNVDVGELTETVHSISLSETMSAALADRLARIPPMSTHPPNRSRRRKSGSSTPSRINPPRTAWPISNIRRIGHR